MGGSVSKSQLTNNQTGIIKMNQMIEKNMQTVLDKYSEIIKSEMGDYYKKLITLLKEPGLNLPQKPIINIAEIFGQKCNTDLVAIFEKKLNRFPIYAIEKSSLFGTTLEPITMEIADSDSIRKQTLCRDLSQLYVSFLDLIEQSVISLVSCRGDMDALIIRLTQSFQGFDGQQSGPIAESAANIKWFKKMKELQNIYTKQIKQLDKFFKKMDGITTLSNKQLNKLINEMQLLNIKTQELPLQCSSLANELKVIQTIDIGIDSECKRLEIPDIDCNKSSIDKVIRNLQEVQRLANEELNQRKNQLTSNIQSVVQSQMPSVVQNKIQSVVQNKMPNTIPKFGGKKHVKNTKSKKK